MYQRIPNVSSPKALLISKVSSPKGHRHIVSLKRQGLLHTKLGSNRKTIFNVVCSKAVVFCKVGLRTRRPEISENPKKNKNEIRFFFNPADLRESSGFY